ncbi:MAG: transposase [bacterium]
MGHIPILEIPEDIHKVCQNYNSVFERKPQFKNFERFITGIIVNDKANIQALAKSFRRGRYDRYDSLHHFLSESLWDYEKIMETSISVIKHLDEPFSFSEKKGWLVIDDTLIEKYGKFMEGTGKLYDHTKGCYLEYGHCLVVFLYIDKRGNRYPLKFDLYLKEDYCEIVKDRFRTKIEIAKELIQ